MSNTINTFDQKPIWVEFKGFFIAAIIIATLGVSFLVFKILQVSNKSVEGLTATSLIRDYNYKIGNDSSPLKLVYFEDFQCPVCSTNHDLISEVEDNYKDKVLFVHKHNPLKEIHSNAIPSARAVQAANRQDKFKEMSDIVFKNQENLGADSLEKYAKEIGLDMEKWKSDKNNREVMDQVDQDRKDLEAIDLPESSIDKTKKPDGKEAGTPTVVLIKNDEVIDWWSGTIPKDRLTAILDSHL
jgi:hypothetical protein